MDAFPAYFSLTGKTVAIAGTGDLAEAKARLFAASPAEIRRLLGPDALGKAAYAGCVLAFIADADETFCAAAARAAREAGVPVNVTDRPALSDFSTPALIDRGSVVAAIGTGGASPMLAASLRGEIEDALPEGVGRLAALLHRLRDEIRDAKPDLAKRRDFLRQALDGPAAQAAMAGRMEDAERLMRQALTEATDRRVGWIKILDGRGPADLLSLRALRVLGEADAIAADEGADPHILMRARRDAPRLELNLEVLMERAGAGGRIVCVVADTAALKTALTEKNYTAQTLPIAAA
jgi:precorrin-2 dehydrogenase/sirohydrochlorin ferrochelatase